jgi:hypothetical protein
MTSFAVRRVDTGSKTSAAAVTTVGAFSVTSVATAVLLASASSSVGCFFTNAVISTSIHDIQLF